jgi:cell division protease FtsH
MNIKNLAMWAVIVFLTIGLYNMFKNPQGSVNQKNTIIFSEFLSEVDNGRVVKVEIKGNNIKGVLSNGNIFTTYSPNDPNLIEKLSNRGVSISASPLEDEMPSLLGVLLSWFPMLLLIAVWIFFMRQMQGGKGGAMGFGKIKSKNDERIKR